MTLQYYAIFFTALCPVVCVSGCLGPTGHRDDRHAARDADALPRNRDLELSDIEANSVNDSEVTNLRAGRAGYWPTVEEVELLYGLVGQDASRATRLLGPPIRVEPLEQDEERWIYDWKASCYIHVIDGQIVDAFYTAGY
jgi:hypothetical protein